jgi:hypothetical protein
MYGKGCEEGRMFKWLARIAIAKKVYDVVQERRRRRR